MSGKPEESESVYDVLREWRDMVCYHDGPVHPLNHGAVMRNLDRIEAALKRDNLLRVPVDVWNDLAKKVESADALRNALENLTRFTESDIRGLESLARYAMYNSVYGGGILQTLTGAIREGKRVMEGGAR